MTEAKTRKVVVTGAAGNIGGKVVDSLRARQDLRLVLLDRQSDPAQGVAAADMGRLSPDWTVTLRGADTVIHLAANPRLNAGWPDLVHDNVDATLNVFHAAATSGVRRVLFASSLQVAVAAEAGSPGVRIAPADPYGASKAVGERIGRHFSEVHGLSVICLRLGMVRRDLNLPPVGHPSLGVQHRWLSNRDLCRAIHLALDAQPIGFAVVNITSATEGSPWSLTDARSVLGYEPLDHYVPVPESAIARTRRQLRRRAGRTLALLRLT
ncbi:MAG: SDR family oxidoreductase [Pseudomonadales bacterium]